MCMPTACAGTCDRDGVEARVIWRCPICQKEFCADCADEHYHEFELKPRWQGEAHVDSRRAGQRTSHARSPAL